MPPAELWVQYSIVGILVLAAGVIAVFFYKLWRELLSWFEKQDALRENERDKQRTWQAEQDRTRDERWRSFLKASQDSWLKQDGEHTDALKDLSKKIDDLIRSVREHDVWTRAKDRE